MRLKICAYLIFIFVIYAVGGIYGDDVSLYQRTRFSTEPEILNLTPGEGKMVVVRAISNLSGNLYISSTSGETAEFEYRKVIRAPDSAIAAGYASLIEVEMKQTPDGLKLQLKSPNPAPWENNYHIGEIEGELKIPELSNLDIDAGYFDIVIEGPFRSLRNRSSFGKLDIHDITERLVLDGYNRQIRLRDIKGDISISTNNSDIIITDMESVGRPIRIRNESGDIRINGSYGSFDIRNGYGTLRMKDIMLDGSVSKIVGAHCPMSLEIIDMDGGTLEIDNTYENIFMMVPDDVSSRLILETELGGEMHVNEMPVRSELVRPDRLQLISGNGEARIIVDVKGGGNINITGWQP